MSFLPVYLHICKIILIFANYNIIMSDWNNKAKRLLKSELIKKGVSNSELADLLNSIGVNESKSSIDSKISRGTFSAGFMLQCLTAMGCTKIILDDFENHYLVAAEPKVKYQTTE